METREVLHGDFSQVGRATGHEIKKLAAFCHLRPPSAHRPDMASGEAAAAKEEMTLADMHRLQETLHAIKEKADKFAEKQRRRKRSPRLHGQAPPGSASSRNAWRRARLKLAAAGVFTSHSSLSSRERPRSQGVSSEGESPVRKTLTQSALHAAKRASLASLSMAQASLAASAAAGGSRSVPVLAAAPALQSALAPSTPGVASRRRLSNIHATLAPGTPTMGGQVVAAHPLAAAKAGAHPMMVASSPSLGGARANARRGTVIGLASASSYPGLGAPQPLDDGSLTRKQRIAAGEEDPDSSKLPVLRRASPSFASPGRDEAPMSEAARVCDHRFALGAPAPGQLPEIGRYMAAYDFIHERQPCVDFGEHPRSVSRRPPKPGAVEVDPFIHQDLTSPTHSFLAAARTSASSSAGEPMRKQSPRPDLHKTYAINMHEASPHARDWCLQDIPSSRRPHVPEWDFQKHHGGKRPALGAELSDPGKYDVDFRALESPVKGLADFDRTLSRAQSASGQMGHNVPMAVLRPDGPVVPDRSLHRTGSRPRVPVKHVGAFAASLPRPAMLKPLTYYKDSDPEVSAAWLERQLEFDGSSAERLISPRQDRAPSMARTISRSDVRGYRLLECGVGSPRSHPSAAASPGLGRPQPRGEQAVPRLRPALGVRDFGHCTGREPSRMAGEFASLTRPRSMAAPDFGRTAPAGFTCKVSPRSVGHATGPPHGHEDNGSSDLQEEAGGHEVELSPLARKTIHIQAEDRPSFAAA